MDRVEADQQAPASDGGDDDHASKAGAGGDIDWAELEADFVKYVGPFDDDDDDVDGTSGDGGDRLVGSVRDGPHIAAQTARGEDGAETPPGDVIHLDEFINSMHVEPELVEQIVRERLAEHNIRIPPATDAETAAQVRRALTDPVGTTLATDKVFGDLMGRHLQSPTVAHDVWRAYESIDSMDDRRKYVAYLERVMASLVAHQERIAAMEQREIAELNRIRSEAEDVIVDHYRRLEAHDVDEEAVAEYAFFLFL